MADTSETTSTTTTLFHKILIPVITTVLGATAIYFLGFNKKATVSQAEIEKATVNAWQSFVSSENINYKVAKSISEEYEAKLTNTFKEKGLKGVVPVFRDFTDDLFRESKKLKGDIEGILKKNDNMDEGFVSMLNRALDNMKDEEEKANVFVENLISLAKSDIDEQEKAQKWQKEAEKFVAMEKRLAERGATEAEDIATALSKKYNRPFDLNELLIYVDYKKEKDKKNPEETANINKTDVSGPAPVDPNRGSEIKENTQNDNNPPYDYNNTNNQTEPTESLLTGNWAMPGCELELSKNGDMFWTFEGKGYTSGGWKLENGKLIMNATNPDTQKTSLLIGYLSNVTRNTLTITFMTSPREVYNLKRKNY